MLTLYILGVFAFLWAVCLALALFFERRIPPFLGALPFGLPLLWVGVCAKLAQTAALEGASTGLVALWGDQFIESLKWGNQGMAEVEWATLPAALLFSLACGLQGLLRTPKNWGMFWTASVLVLFLIATTVAFPLWIGHVDGITLVSVGLILVMGVATACSFLGAGRNSAGPEAAATTGLVLVFAVSAMSLAHMGDETNTVFEAFSQVHIESSDALFYSGWSLISAHRVVGTASLLIATLIAGIGLGGLGEGSRLRGLGFVLGAMWLILGPWAYFSFQVPQVYMATKRVVQVKVFHRPGDDFRLPEGESAARAQISTSITVTKTRLLLNGEEVTSLPLKNPGALREKLKGEHKRLLKGYASRDKVFRGRLLVLADRDTLFAVLRKVLKEATNVGFAGIELVVDVGYGAQKVHLTDPQREQLLLQQTASVPLNIWIQESGFRFGSESVLPCIGGRCRDWEQYDEAGLRKALKGALRKQADGANIVLIPADGVPYEVLARTLGVIGFEVSAEMGESEIRLGL